MATNYTLIIPHFNIPKLLRRLLRTVPQRDDMQVIVVDDCSTKELGELKSVKQEFDWVEWYSTGTNGGGGKARNIGLSHAKGRYVFFADADDYFLPSIYDILDTYKNSEFDLLFFNVNSLETNTYKDSNRTKYINHWFDLKDSNESLSQFKLRYTFGEPWGKIINRRIIVDNDIRFQELPCHNDSYFSYRIGHVGQKIIVDTRITYIVTYRNDSVVNTQFDNRYEIMINVFTQKEKYFINHNINEHAYDPFDYIITNAFHGNFKEMKKAYHDVSSNLSLRHVNQVLWKRIWKRLLYIIGNSTNHSLLD